MSNTLTKKFTLLKSLGACSLLFLSTIVQGAHKNVQSTSVWVRMDPMEFKEFENFSFLEKRNLQRFGESVLFQVKEKELSKLNYFFHTTKNRCGGFFASTHHPRSQAQSTTATVVNYQITKQDVIDPLLLQLDDLNIMRTIQKMESLHNRYYKSQTGVNASELVFSMWQSLTKHRNDFSINYFTHPNWPQKSVILTWKGTENPDQKVILGGHLDSISGFWMPDYSRAPGADDNASGISTLTEVIRVLSQSNYAPKNTIVFMAYSAEEVGLRGSQEIAQSYAAKNEQVLGVVQFDMTNFQNGPIEIGLMTDYTNAQQNQFMGQLIDQYVGVKWGYSQCGYGCSDHASWHNARFKASMPFEAIMENMNSAIHTQNDTLSTLGNSTDHALKFAKLGLSFAVEMGK